MINICDRILWYFNIRSRLKDEINYYERQLEDLNIENLEVYLDIYETYQDRIFLLKSLLKLKK